MLLFTAVAATIFHNFWGVPADQAQNQMIHFMKTLSITRQRLLCRYILGLILASQLHGESPGPRDRCSPQLPCRAEIKQGRGEFTFSHIRAGLATGR